MKDIDAVLIATPDMTHPRILMDAVAAGKDVYVEKPFAVDFAEGKIRTNRLSLYRVPRFSDAPVLETVLLDRKDLPSAGAGETPIVALAPALAGALFTATGIRRRSLPLAPKGISA